MAEYGRDKNAIKAGMSIQQVYDFLVGQGIQGNWVDEHQLVFETVCHNHKGEGSHKLYYYDNTKLFNCYTGCGRFDIFELLSKMYMNEYHEELLLEEAIDIYIQSQEFMTLGDNDMLHNDDLDIEYQEPSFMFYDKKPYLRYPRIIVNDWEREGISAETQHKYNIRYNYATTGLMFPHLDEEGNLLGIRQRIANKEMIERYGKYRPVEREGILYSSPLSFYLFDLFFNANNIRRERKAIVFEGEKSVMKMDDLLSPKKNIGVAAFGMHFSRHQYEALKKLGVEEIIFAFDRQFQSMKYDREYDNLVGIFKTIQERFGTNEDGIKISFILDTNMISGYKDSPVDCGFEVFAELYGERKTYKEIEENFVEKLELWDSIGTDEEEYDIY